MVRPEARRISGFRSRQSATMSSWCFMAVSSAARSGSRGCERAMVEAAVLDDIGHWEWGGGPPQRLRLRGERATARRSAVRREMIRGDNMDGNPMGFVGGAGSA